MSECLEEDAEKIHYHLWTVLTEPMKDQYSRAVATEGIRMAYRRIFVQL